MRLPHWAKLSNKKEKEKNNIYVVIFLDPFKQHEHFWMTEIEWEEQTRQGQQNVAADWDISWEAAASKTLQVT